MITGQPGLAEVVVGGVVEFFVAQQVHLRLGLGVPVGDAAGEGASGHGVQHVLDVHQLGAGQLVQVGAGQATAGRGEQTEQVLFDRGALQEDAVEFSL
jgi:hypothetical protein